LRLGRRVFSGAWRAGQFLVLDEFLVGF
jgi:hypothetical protein